MLEYSESPVKILWPSPKNYSVYPNSLSLTLTTEKNNITYLKEQTKRLLFGQEIIINFKLQIKIENSEWL